MRKFLLLFGLLLVILLTVLIGRQIKRISNPKMGAESRVNSERKAAAPEALAKPIGPTEGTKAVSRIRDASGTNIIICVLDAARFDHMGCYGYPRPTTPNIDRLAKASLVFEQHYCQYPMTEQSTRALFESRYVLRRPLRCSSLVESFQRLGFNTSFFSANPRISGLGPERRGFTNIVTAFPPSSGDRPRQTAQSAKASSAKKSEEDLFYRPEYQLAQIKGWLAKKPGRPFFAYIHFMPPHIPYAAPKNLKAIFHGKQPPLYWQASSAMLAAGEAEALIEGPSAVVGTVEETMNLYDANLRWGDEAVGQLEQALRKAGLFDNTLLMVMADHGETLGEHGYRWHSDCPYNETLQIPLIMHFPGKDAPRGRLTALTQTIDLLPTLFDMHNLPWPGTAQGRSLLPLLAGAAARTNEYSFSLAGVGWKSEVFVVRDLQSTLLLKEDGKTRALYDNVKDPHQTKNIITSEPGRAAKLVAAFRGFALAQPHPPLYFIDPKIKRKAGGDSEEAQTQNMPEKLKKQLKTIGYLK